MSVKCSLSSNVKPHQQQREQNPEVSKGRRQNIYLTRERQRLAKIAKDNTGEYRLLLICYPPRGNTEIATTNYFSS